MQPKSVAQSLPLSVCEYVYLSGYSTDSVVITWPHMAYILTNLECLTTEPLSWQCLKLLCMRIELSRAFNGRMHNRFRIMCLQSPVEHS